MNVLIVEDEKRLAQALGQIMKSQNYNAEIVFDGNEGLYYAQNGDYDVIILDIMLPGITGLEIVKKLRENKDCTPVLMLTARDEISDKVKGLDYGADDYMTKPFYTEELLARVRSLSRRQGEVVLDELVLMDLTLNISSHTLSSGLKSIHLGFKEFEVMKILMSNKNTITPKEELITKIWGSDSDAEDNNVEAYISFLRKKMQYLHSSAHIETVRKVGYKLEDSGND